MAGGRNYKGGHTVNGLFTKLSQSRGESLTESLCSVLLVALSSAVLASMIAAANHMNSVAIEQDRAFYQELNAAENRTDSLPGTVSVAGNVDGAPYAFTYSVLLHGGEDALTAYSLEGVP